MRESDETVHPACLITRRFSTLRLHLEVDHSYPSIHVVIKNIKKNPKLGLSRTAL